MNALSPAEKLQRQWSERTERDDQLVEIEQRVLGWQMRPAPAVTAEVEAARPDLGTWHAPHDAIQRALYAAFREGTELTPAAVAQRLAENEAIKSLGGRDYLVKLARLAPVALGDQDAIAQAKRSLATHAELTEAARYRKLAQRLVMAADDGAVQAARAWALELGREAELSSASRAIVAQPFAWRAPETIPTRQWIFGRHAVRRFVSATAAAGGTGKTALAIAEALSVATGRPLLKDGPVERGRVWLLGLEDPGEEYERRIAAAALLHKLDPGEFAGGLFMNSARDDAFVIARAGRNGLEIACPVVAAISRNIREHSIDLVVVDPFCAVHAVPEVDNSAIAAVVREWARIADETGCAVELVHHLRKGAGSEATADDARGASALVNAARSVRVLAPMGSDAAERFGVEPDERRRFFAVSSAKANLAMVGGEAWRELVSITLKNGQGGPDDHVGAVQAWARPDAAAGICSADQAAILERLREGAWRADVQAKAWAGLAVAEVMGWDGSDRETRRAISALLRTWEREGIVRTARRTDKDSRHPRNFIVPGEL